MVVLTCVFTKQVPLKALGNATWHMRPRGDDVLRLGSAQPACAWERASNSDVVSSSFFLFFFSFFVCL